MLFPLLIILCHPNVVVIQELQVSREIRALALSGKTMRAPDVFSSNSSLQRKYDVRIVKPPHKQYISTVANDLKAKIEMSSLCREDC